MTTKFVPDRVAITSSAADKLAAAAVGASVARHLRGDWGTIDESDRLDNEAALEHGGRLMGRYTDDAGTVFWIITEADRSVTTVLLPEDY